MARREHSDLPTLMTWSVDARSPIVLGPGRTAFVREEGDLMRRGALELGAGEAVLMIRGCLKERRIRRKHRVVWRRRVRPTATARR